MEVRFENVFKKYGNVIAVSDLNLKIISGSLHFILGPSGCGKTTTLRMLAGLEIPSGGKIFFGDQNVADIPVARRGIGMVFQNYALWPHMTVRQNIEYGLKLRKLDKKTMASRLEEVLQFTQLERYIDRLPGQLSGGQQQRVALARALAIRPNILLLDEPLSNLDARLRLEMRENITRIHQQTGITTVYVTHDQKESLSMGTHITVMDKGRVIQTDTPKMLYRHPKTAFLANFIGETNLFEADFVSYDESHDLTLVDSVIGKLSFKGRMENLTDTKLTLSIRPESIRIFSDDLMSHSFQGPGINRLELDVYRTIYLGECEQLLLSRDSSHVIKANVFNVTEKKILQVGSKVICYIKPEDVVAFPRHELLQMENH